MGASVSRQKIELYNETIVDVIVEASQQTAAYVKQSMVQECSGFCLFQYQSGKAKTSIAALQEVQITNDLVKTIKEKIMQDVKADSKNPLSVSYAEADTKVTNILSTRLTDKTKQLCVGAVEAAMRQSTSGFSVVQIQKGIVELLLQCQQFKSISQEIVENIYQNLSQEGEASTDTAPWLTNLTKAAPYIAVFVLLVVGGIILSMFTKKPTQQQEDMQNAQPEQQGAQPASSTAANTQQQVKDSQPDGLPQPANTQQQKERRGLFAKKQPKPASTKRI